MKNNILIIGFGNIGQRHFQSFYAKGEKLKIYIIDKNFEYTKNLIKKSYNTNSKIKIVVLNNLDRLQQKNFFLTIIATNSDVRFLIFKRLLSKLNSKHIILEKITFKNNLEFKKSIQLIKKYSSIVWVNLARREQSIIRHIKSKIKIKKKITIKFYGSNWGMASNIIHFLDLFNWITNAKKITYKESLSKKIYKAKREKFYEIKGKIEFKDDNKNLLKISDDKIHNKNIFEISNDGNIYKISDNILYLKFNKKKIIKKFSSNFQSKLTYKLYRKLLKNDLCNLPKLEDTKHIHEIFYDILAQKFKKYLFT
jgi:hypothetical protein